MRLVFVFCAAAAAYAQTAAEPAALGYVYDSVRKEVRAVAGTAGAARQHLSTALGADAIAAVHPKNGWTLLGSGADAPLVLTQPGIEEPAEVVDSRVSPISIVLSPAGSAALVRFAGTATAQIITGIPQSPRAHDVDIGAIAGARALAVSDDGTRIAVLTASQILLFTEAGEPHASLERTAAFLAFVEGTRDLLVVATDAGSVGLLADSREFTELASAAKPLAAWMDSGRQRLLAAGGEAVEIIDLESGDRRLLPLAVETRSIHPLRSTGLFLLTSAPGEPLWVLDLAGEEPASWFIPAVVSPEESR